MRRTESPYGARRPALINERQILSVKVPLRYDVCVAQFGQSGKDLIFPSEVLNENVFLRKVIRVTNFCFSL